MTAEYKANMQPNLACQLPSFLKSVRVPHYWSQLFARKLVSVSRAALGSGGWVCRQGEKPKMRKSTAFLIIALVALLIVAPSLRAETVSTHTTFIHHAYTDL